MFYTILKGILTIVLVFLAIIGMGTIYFLIVASYNENDNQNEE